MRKIINGGAIKRMLWKRKRNISASYMSANYYIHGDSLSETREEFDTEISGGRIAVGILLILLTFPVQEAFFNDLRLFGVKPNLSLVILFILSALSKPRFAMFYGLGLGLYTDIIYGKYLGFYALLFMYMGAVTAFLIRPKLKGRISVVMGAAPIAFFVYALTESFFARLLMIYSAESSVLYVDYWQHMTVRILPAVLYNVIVLFVTVWPVTALWAKLGNPMKVFYRFF